MKEPRPNVMDSVPEVLVLRCLRDREMHGYELAQEIRGQTEATMRLGEGVVYPVLYALERKGALQSRRKAVHGRSRVYYALTPKGTKRLIGLSYANAMFTDAFARVIQGGVYDGAV